LPSRYTADAAKTQGTSERTVQREAARGAAIPDVASLAGTSLDTPKELDALASMPPKAQVPVFRRNKWIATLRSLSGPSELLRRNSFPKRRNARTGERPLLAA
jgi:hypothetical protein